MKRSKGKNRMRRFMVSTQEPMEFSIWSIIFKRKENNWEEFTLRDETSSFTLWASVVANIHSSLSLCLAVVCFLLIILVLSHCFDPFLGPKLICVPSWPGLAHWSESVLLCCLKMIFDSCSTCNPWILGSRSALFYLSLLWSRQCWREETLLFMCPSGNVLLEERGAFRSH